MKDRETQGMACAELAQLYLRKGDLEKAVDYCGQASTLLPQLHSGQAVINRILARVAVATDRLDEAKRRFQMAADGFKQAESLREWDETMFELSRLFLQEGDDRKVIEVLKTMREYARQAGELVGVLCVNSPHSEKQQREIREEDHL